MTGNVKVSVIIPVYKVEQYLGACLDSVLVQTLTDIEVICVDDASPDRCPEILDEYAARDSRIKPIHLADNGKQGRARNIGMVAAEGKYLYFLDSDDMIEPNSLEELFALADRDSLDGIFFDSKVIFEDDTLAKRNAAYPAVRTGNYEDRIMSGKEIFEAFVLQNEWTSYPQRQFWLRDMITRNAVLFPENTEHEDELFAYEATLLAERVRYIPETYFIRRYRSDSVMTRTPGPNDFHGYFRIFSLMTDFVETHGFRSAAVDIDLGRIYEKMVRFLPLFEDQNDPERWFETEEEKRQYRFFLYTQREGAYYRQICRNVIARLPEGCRVWIYGAGVIGRKVCRGLIDAGVLVEGFIITKRGRDPEVLMGRPVMTAGEVRPEADRIALIAVSKGFRSEIKENLDRLGWTSVELD